MQPVNMTRDLQNIVKEGFLEKQSRFLKSWRKRWFVLTNTTLYSFKQRKVYSNPTQSISLRTVTTIKSYDMDKQFCFKITTTERQYILAATSNVQKQQWVGNIGKFMIKAGKAMVKLTNKQQEQ